MGLPVLENGPYFFNVNNKYIGSTWQQRSQRVWYGIKEALVGLDSGNIWSVVASSDGAGNFKNIGDADPDLWADYTKVVGGSGNHSWVILENAFTNAQVSIDLTNTDENLGQMIYSYTGGFNADGTASTLPTYSEGYEVHSISHGIGLGASDYLVAVVSAMCSNDKKTTRFYVHYKSSSTGASGGFFFTIEEAVNTPSQWIATNKTCVMRHMETVATSTTPASKSPTIYHMSNSARTLCRMETAEPYEGWNSCYLTAECYGELDDKDGRGIMRHNVELDLHGGYPVAPIGLYRTSGGSIGGSWGRLRDIYWAQHLHDTLNTYPADVTRQWIKWGCFLVPWNGSAPVDAVP